MKEKIFLTKLSQGKRHGFITKLKEQKNNPNSGCFLILWVNQSKLSLSENGYCVLGPKWTSLRGIHAMWPSLQPHTAWLNVYKGQFKLRGEGCYQALSFYMTILYLTAASTKRAPAAFSVAHFWSLSLQPRLGSIQFSPLCTHEPLTRRTALLHRQWAADQHRKKIESTDSYFLPEGYWILGTTLHQISKSEIAASVRNCYK